MDQLEWQLRSPCMTATQIFFVLFYINHLLYLFFSWATLHQLPQTQVSCFLLKQGEREGTDRQREVGEPVINMWPRVIASKHAGSLCSSASKRWQDERGIHFENTYWHHLKGCTPAALPHSSCMAVLVSCRHPQSKSHVQFGSAIARAWGALSLSSCATARWQWDNQWWRETAAGVTIKTGPPLIYGKIYHFSTWVS